MTDTNDINENQTEEFFESTPEPKIEISELDSLKETAKKLGLKYHTNIGVDTLKERVQAALSGDVTPDPIAVPVKKTKRKLTEADKLRIYHTRLRNEANRLHRVRITCMNPSKASYPGEIFNVSNKIVNIKKFIPYNDTVGYHVPEIILKQLESRKYQSFIDVKLPNGQTIKKSKLVPEFAIEKMAPLTEEERKELARTQALNKSID